MKNILYLSFYFEPDLCAGSFRNTPLAYELAEQVKGKAVDIDILTTIPNRYHSFKQESCEVEERENMTIRRIEIPTHQSGFKDQILSFRRYYNAVLGITSGKKYDMVFASSSRLFTAYLGYKIASERKIPLYLDIRDIFVDTIKDVFSNPVLKSFVLPVLKYIEKKTFGYASHINLISGGFRDYFKKYDHAVYSNFSNGIDQEFLICPKTGLNTSNDKKTILYAGNIGEGQGLHKIIPEAAALLGNDYKFKIIGAGGATHKLSEALKILRVDNVEILPPMARNLLINEYNNADFLFIHLNDYEAFKKVLPSKVFELGVFPKPLIAGVSGYAREFISENLPGSILIDPCNSWELAQKLKNYEYNGSPDRTLFVNKYSRESINIKMAESILGYI